MKYIEKINNLDKINNIENLNNIEIVYINL